MSFFRFKYITIAIVLCITGQVSHAEQIIQYPNSKITASSILPITKDKLNLIVLAAQLCNATYDANYARTVVPSANYVQQPNGGADAALTLDIDDAFCIVAFRGSLTPTKISNDIIEDWIFQNLNANPLFVNKRNDITQGCTVQEGFFKAYAGVGIAPIESFIDTCMSAGSKQLVFTGHSQGGAVAAIASIVYNDYNPLTITFGQPPFVRRDTDCPILNKHHVWRIINTENSRNGLQYDPLPFIGLYEHYINIDLIGPQIGSSIHLPPNWENDYNPDPMSSNVLYRSISDTDTYMTIPNFDFSPDNGEFVSAHRIDGYVEKLVKMLYTGSDPLETNGYISGTQCQSDIECKSFTSGTGGGCTNNVCADTQPDNNRCRDRSDCATGRCDLTWSGILECQEKKSKGSMCNEDSDCSSGVCSWLWTCK